MQIWYPLNTRVYGRIRRANTLAGPLPRLWHILADRYRLPGRVALVIAPQMAHAAEEPGLDPVPQTADGL